MKTILTRDLQEVKRADRHDLKGSRIFIFLPLFQHFLVKQEHEAGAKNVLSAVFDQLIKVLDSGHLGV